MGLTKIETEARKRIESIRRHMAEDIVRMREDTGASQRQLAHAGEISQGYLSRIEHGSAEPTLEVYALLAAALGADLACRLYPNTGSPIRDRHQSAIAVAMLRLAHARWAPWPEVGVRSPARGSIDLVFHDAVGHLAVATEIESELHRLEQLLRWSQEKAASLPSAGVWPYRDGEMSTISRLLVVRVTRHNREVVREFGPLLAASYPGSPEAALASLTGTGPWPGAAMLWAHRGPNGYRIAASPIVPRRPIAPRP
jgi:transcriptional regulator with XRE-family HTH domain